MNRLPWSQVTSQGWLGLRKADARRSREELFNQGWGSPRNGERYNLCCVRAWKAQGGAAAEPLCGLQPAIPPASATSWLLATLHFAFLLH